MELYLTIPGPPGTKKGTNTATNGVNGAHGETQESILRKKAINVLKSDLIPYDPTHALIIYSGHGYTDGLVLLWERLEMFEEVVWFWIDKGRKIRLMPQVRW